MPDSNPHASLSLTRKERRWIGALFLLFVLVGVITEIRTVCQERPKGDLMVFLRTAWAVRAGADIYAVTDHNGWHYHYPPLLAILMTPIANPPPLVAMPGTLPYPASVAVWYTFNVLLLLLGVHMLAGALARSIDPTVVAGSRRWWAWRVVPIVACLPPIMHTLVRGQVGVLLLFLLCGAIAAFLRKRSGQAGVWLAGAICLKVIPVFLLIYPLWRRDLRCLTGCAAGLAIGLGLIPAAVFGPARTVGYYREWTEALLLPAMARGNDHMRDRELINVTATHSQSYLPVLHNLANPREEDRPVQASAPTRLAHRLIAVVLTLATLLAAGRRPDHGTATLLFLGALILMMALASPICHTHYFVLSIPIIMGIVAAFPASPKRWVDRRLRLLVGVNLVANALPLMDGMEPLRDFGLITLTALTLWSIACVLLWRRPPDPIGETNVLLPLPPQLIGCDLLAENHSGERDRISA